MTQEKKHSELPWKIQKAGESILIVNEDEVVATTHYNNCIAPQSAMSNAEFILRACNNFYPLLEACQKALEEYETNDYTHSTRKELEQAIKAAEEG